MTEPAAIRARGLTRRFGALTAVDGLDLVVPPAQIYGFLGPNGSGKSTTIRMLCGLLRPSDGEVEVLSYRMPQDAERVKREIGYMTQKFSLYEDLTVRENLQFLADVYALPRATIRARIDTALNRYRLTEQAKQLAGTMSGGQKQRLALAGATLHEPKLLILDEPTSAVDPQGRRDFWDGLFDLAGNGTTILVSTHYMDEAERCHRLAILDFGKLVTEGRPRDLMRDIAAQVYEVEVGEPRRAGAVIADLAGVLSVAQLGSRLHVLVEPERADAAAMLNAALAQAGMGAEVERVAPNLEDVFVAATGFGLEARNVA